MKGYRPEELMAVLTRLFVFHPKATLTKNAVGNLAILNEEGGQVGYIDIAFPRASELPEDVP